MTRSFSGKSMAGDLLLVVACLCLCVVSSVGELPRYEHPIKSDGSLRFLAVGDWGRKGTHNQSLVAYQMGIIGEKLEIDFVISTGDNFYDDGLKSVQDTAFEESFMNIYTAESLNKPWYTVLGNHDYRGDAIAQISPILKKIDRRWFCYKSFLLNADQIAEFFFVDTTPFVETYFTKPKDHVYDWRGVSPRGHYIAKLLKDLESALSESSARWKIVVGHHAIRSAGHHGDTKELVDLLLPLLKAYDVDFYINGHDHCLEHISDDQSSIQFLTSGGGSKAWRGDVKYNHRGLKLFYDGQGFMSVKLTETDAEIIFYDVFANVLHQWKRQKQVYSAI